jgi:hypothetical protein
MDPSGSIFAVGKTSSLVGHTLQVCLLIPNLPLMLLPSQPVLSTLSQQHSNQSHEGYNLLHALDEEDGSDHRHQKLQPCTLVLIDRTIDLFTPSSHDPSPPLAQRVKCTLQQTKLPHLESLDISLTQSLTALLSAEDANLSSHPSHHPISSPLSAVSALPIPITPSIAPPYLCPPQDPSANDLFMNAMFATSEEAGKGILYEALRKTIAESNGTLPPSKKRGIGAELLGLVNAILSSPSRGGADHSSPPYNVNLCVESSGLLSWSLALIDSLQRSSTKQLQSHLSSLPEEAQHLLRCMSSYEMKSTRERVLLSSLLQQHQLSLLSYAAITEIILESCGLPPDGGEIGGGVVDVEHMFQMLLG